MLGIRVQGFYVGFRDSMLAGVFERLCHQPVRCQERLVQTRLTVEARKLEHGFRRIRARIPYNFP